MDDLIMEIPGAATPGFCEMMIKKFEQEDRAVQPGMIGPRAEVDKTVRDSHNLEMHLLPDWEGVVEDVRKMLFSRLKTYLDEIHVGKTRSLYQNGYDGSYTMMRYDPGSVGYDWHNDFSYDNHPSRPGCRTVTWLFYLNECGGGETEFLNGRKIKPETGKLVLFPSTWCMVHRGLPVHSGEKYLCVGWLCSTWNKGMNPAT